MRSYSGPQFPAFGLNKERYSVSADKMRTRITPNTDAFYAVTIPKLIQKLLLVFTGMIINCHMNVKIFLTTERFQG